MLHRLSERIAFLVYEKTDLCSVEIYVYGFELIISSIVETSALIIIGGLTHKMIETIIFLLSFSSIRIFSGGYHAKSYLRCFIVTLAGYTLVRLIYNLLLSLDTYKIVIIGIIELVISFVIFAIICPINNSDKTIFNCRLQKRLAIIALCINVGLAIAIPSITNVSVLIIVLPTVLVVDALVIIEKLKQGVDKNENKNEKRD